MVRSEKKKRKEKAKDKGKIKNKNGNTKRGIAQASPCPKQATSLSPRITVRLHTVHYFHVKILQRLVPRGSFEIAMDRKDRMSSGG
jgi:hypothetical protein